MRNKIPFDELEVLERLEEIDLQAVGGLTCESIMVAHHQYPKRYPGMNLVYKVGGIKKVKEILNRKYIRTAIGRAYLESCSWT
jgi:hypothetical protein